MFKWFWLTRKDSNDVIIGLVATKKDANYARCFLCSFDLKYSTQGLQTFTLQSVVKYHKDVSKRSFGENKTQNTFYSTSLSKALPRPSLALDAAYLARK